MPNYLRKYNIQKISDIIKEENEAIKKAKGETSMKDLATGDMKQFKPPDYMTKAPIKKR